MINRLTIRTALFLLASVGDLPGDIHAAELDGGWSVEIPLELSANSHFMADGRHRSRFQSLSVGTGLELSPWHDRWAAGVFVEQHLVDHPGFDGLTFAGLYMTGQSGAWDTSSAVMLGKTAGAAAAWHYAARLRCDLGGGQKLGILAGVPLRDPALTNVVLSWEAKVRAGLSLSVAAGATISHPVRHSLEFSLVWQVL